MEGVEGAGGDRATAKDWRRLAEGQEDKRACPEGEEHNAGPVEIKDNVVDSIMKEEKVRRSTQHYHQG